MNNEKEIKVEMVRVNDDLTPYVKIDYVDNDAQQHPGIFVVDSCSIHNILYRERAHDLGLGYKLTNKTVSISTITNTVVEASFGKVAFTFAGRQFVENFCISDNDNNLFDNNVCDLPVIGILGNLFLQKHNLVIDYSNTTLYTSNTSPENLPVSDCDFFFPMGIGLKHYGLPILSLRQDGKEVVAIVDSGSTDNILSSEVITEIGFDCHYLETTDTVSGLMGNVEAKDAVMSFCLLTLTENGTDEVAYEDKFKVLPHTLLSPEEGQCDENGNELPPIVSLIGSPFMSRENWVLDFGARIIYKRKVDKTHGLECPCKKSE